MKPVRVPIIRVVALFALTGIFVWNVPLPAAQQSSSALSKMSR